MLATSTVCTTATSTPSTDHVDECKIAVDATNPASCTPAHKCAGHAPDHLHGASCECPTVPHGDHIDYLLDGYLYRRALGTATTTEPCAVPDRLPSSP
jgi:hypothetical protein